MGEMADWFRQQMEYAKHMQKATEIAQKHRKTFEKYRRDLYNTTLDIVVFTCDTCAKELDYPDVTVAEVAVAVLELVEDAASYLTSKHTIGELVRDACERLKILKQSEE